MSCRRCYDIDDESLELIRHYGLSKMAVTIAAAYESLPAEYKEKLDKIALELKYELLEDEDKESFHCYAEQAVRDAENALEKIKTLKKLKEKETEK